MRLFQPGAAWDAAAAHVQVFKLYPNFVRKASDTELVTVFDWLKRRGISLAVEIGFVKPIAYCRRVEGYDNDQLRVAQRIRRLGGDLKYVIADEPLSHGHGYAGPGSCQSAVSEVAASSAVSAREFQSLFPNVQFALTESIAYFTTLTRINELGEFLDDFHAMDGRSFSAVEYDVAWWHPIWRREAVALTAYLHRRGVRVGVIYNANRNARSDREWLDLAREHFREYESLMGSPPDDAVFQSWDEYPKRLLPDTDPDAFTSIILDYVNFERSLASRRNIR